MRDMDSTVWKQSASDNFQRKLIDDDSYKQAKVQNLHFIFKLNLKQAKGKKTIEQGFARLRLKVYALKFLAQQKCVKVLVHSCESGIQSSPVTFTHP